MSKRRQRTTDNKKNKVSKFAKDIAAVTYRLENVLGKSLFNVSYDVMEFSDLLGDEKFIDSYNESSRKKGRHMKPKVKPNGCFFELR